MARTKQQFLDALEVGRRVAKGQVSPVALTEAMLKRIARLDKRLHSFATVTAELALKQAAAAEREAEKGKIRGALHGVPIALKDLCYTRGIRTAAGTAIHRDFKPRFDATVTARLRAAGAILLGKLQLTEGAFADHHPSVTVPANPWGKDLWAGASSSGSGVATAAGLCFASLGSDTGGSIRFPSASNGITGLKPTWGRVSRHGVFDLAPTLDHVGPMARSAADCGAVLGAMAGPDPKDPTALQDRVPNYLAGLERGIAGLRIGIDDAYNSDGVDKPVVDAVNAAADVLADLGAEIRKVRYPDTTEVCVGWTEHCAIETAVVHAASYPKRKDEYGEALAGLIETGRAHGAFDLQKTRLTRLDFAGRTAALFQDIDLLLCPAMWTAGLTLKGFTKVGENWDAMTTRVFRFTAPADYTGEPSLTMPGGFTRAGAPIAVQLVGPRLSEDVLVRAGHAFQQATDWHTRHPAGV